MAIEECSELIKALCKLSRGGSADDVIEEIADVHMKIYDRKRDTKGVGRKNDHN